MTEIRVLTWNIRHGLTNDGFVDIHAYVDEAKKYIPDVILLQEVDSGVRRSGKTDQLRFFKESFGFQWTALFAPRLKMQGGQYGLAALIRFPVYRTKNHLLSGLHAEKCVAQELEIEIDGHQTSVINLHMPYERHTGKSHTSLSWKNLNEMQLPPNLIIGGDFNVRPESFNLKPLLSECIDIGEKTTSSYGRIDYCMGRGVLQPAKQEVFSSDLSDHFPFVTTFLLKTFDT